MGLQNVLESDLSSHSNQNYWSDFLLPRSRVWVYYIIHRYLHILWYFLCHLFQLGHFYLLFTHSHQGSSEYLICGLIVAEMSSPWKNLFWFVYIITSSACCDGLHFKSRFHSAVKLENSEIVDFYLKERAWVTDAPFLPGPVEEMEENIWSVEYWRESELKVP